MLQNLRIEHLAIIDHLELDFSPGLNILTGETGAGKSIIVNAIKLLLGERASIEFIRHGEETAIIEALFLLDEKTIQIIRQKGFDVSDELLIKRIISRSGKSKTFINGQLATLPILFQITKELFILSGQHEYQKILSPEYQLFLLDTFCNLEEKEKFQEAYRKLLTLIKQKEELLEKIAHSEERRVLLTFQQKELEEAKLQDGEEEELLQQRMVLQHVEFLKQVAEESYLWLYSNDNAVVNILSNIIRQMEKGASYESKWQKWVEILRNSLYQIEDVAHDLNSYKETLFFDPEQLESVERRLAELNDLKKKYKVHSIAELLVIKDKIKNELAKSEDLTIYAKKLDEQIDTIKEDLINIAENLTKRRKEASSNLQKLLESFLKTLGMPYACCEIKFIPLKSGLFLKEGFWVNENGAEEIEILFSANLGEPLKPLAKIASGGELARFLLAIKSILGEKAGTETIIFDEIDSGVGGDLGVVIGDCLKKLAQTHQIICITHLPQIASYGDAHFKVEKKIISGRTITSVRLLKEEEKIEELVRMLGGKSESYDYARTLLEQSNK